MKIEGFIYNSFCEEIVEQILAMYVAGAGYQMIADSELPVSFASAQRIVGEAFRRGLLSSEEKHGVGAVPLKARRAQRYVKKFPEAKPRQLAQLVGCSENTIYRAKRGE